MNANKFYTIAFCNAKQMLINIQQSLKILDPNIVVKVNPNKTVTIKNDNTARDNDWKSKTMLEIKEYFSKRATFCEMKLSAEVVNNPRVVEELTQNLKETSRLNSALYFEVKSDLLLCYGTKLVLAKKIQSLPDLVQNLVEKQLLTEPKQV